MIPATWVAFCLWAALGVLLLVPALMLILHLARPEFRYHWPIAALTAALVWPLILLIRPTTYISIPLFTWRPLELFPNSPAMLVDSLSWSYAVALATVTLAILLTAVVRSTPLNWRAWAGTLALAGLGLLAIFAGNPLTLLLAWVALDLLEFLVLLFQAPQESLRQGAILNLAGRLVGIAILLWAVIAVRSTGQIFDFHAIPQAAALLLIVAAGLRLGVLPLQLPLIQDIPLRRGVGTMLRLAPAAGSLVLLTRTAAVGVETGWTALILAFCGLAAFYGGAAWLSAEDEMKGRPFWMLGLGGLAVAAAARGRPEACLAWGLALILPGALISLLSTQRRRFAWLMLAGWVGVSAMPWTPAWTGAQLYGAAGSGLPFVDWTVDVLFFLSQAMLLVGFLRHAFRSQEEPAWSEPWIVLIYGVGLVFLPVAHFMTAWLTYPFGEPVPTAAWWVGVLAAVLGGGGWWLARRDPILLPVETAFRGSLDWSGSAMARVLSLNWAYRSIWLVYRWIGRLLSLLSRILEGDGGLLWALLLLLLLYSLAIAVGVEAI